MLYMNLEIQFITNSNSHTLCPSSSDKQASHCHSFLSCGVLYWLVSIGGSRYTSPSRTESH